MGRYATEEIKNSTVFKAVTEKMRAMEEYKKIGIFHKGPREKAEIMRRTFSKAFVDFLNNESGLTPSEWPSMNQYLEVIFEVENVDIRFLPETAKEIAKEKTNGTLSNLRGSIALEKKLPQESDDESASDEPIIEARLPEPIIERESPIQEGRINVQHTTKEARQKKLQDEYLTNLNKKMLR